jgi:hypothetical protein
MKGDMAEQHGMQPEHHTPLPEKDFYDRARQRLDQALKNIAELEERMAKRVGRSSAEQRGPNERVS